MIVVQSAGELRTALDGRPRAVGFVPTMGALHNGHASLFRGARHECSTVVASIFVNALQFENSDDLSKYPRTLDRDLGICSEHGVDILYVPDDHSMYPAGFSTVVSTGRLARILEGADRPGHFDGVATVVTKLLSACRADIAYFGQKDFQQLAVIRRLVTDLDIGTDIRMMPTIRDDDGLALSSRNSRLTREGRRIALAIPRALEAARSCYVIGESGRELAERAMKRELSIEGITLHYAVVLDPKTFAEADPGTLDPVALIAATVEGVRLIDNTTLT